MRNPNRLDNFYSQLCEIHKKSFSDWRFGQFMINFLEYVMKVSKIDPFFIEENQMITYLKEYCGEDNNN